MRLIKNKLLKITYLALLLAVTTAHTAISQANKAANKPAYNVAPNLIIITTDGFRWQEVFGGMDTAIANQSEFNQGDSTYIYNKYGANDLATRQKKLMPFFWNQVAKEGMLFGNRDVNNNVDVANPHWFSYPGYNEIFTGYPDTAINSNDYMPNPHTNIFAFLNAQPAYKNKVAAFGAWDAFDRILNEKVSGFPVINGFESITTRSCCSKYWSRIKGFL